MAKKKKEKPFGLKQIRIEKLNENHVPFFEDFQSYDKDLADFLRENAIDNQDKAISVTYLAFDISKEPKLLGYITLLTDSVVLKGLDKDLVEQLDGKGINYPTLPALKIGRWCIDERYRQRRLGRMFWLLTLKKVYELSKFVGCRFVTVEAKQEKDGNGLNALRYYKEKLGFELLKFKNKGRRHPHMYFDAYKIIKSLKDNSS